MPVQVVSHDHPRDIGEGGEQLNCLRCKCSASARYSRVAAVKAERINFHASESDNRMRRPFKHMGLDQKE